MCKTLLEHNFKSNHDLQTGSDLGKFEQRKQSNYLPRVSSYYENKLATSDFTFTPKGDLMIHSVAPSLKMKKNFAKDLKASTKVENDTFLFDSHLSRTHDVDFYKTKGYKSTFVRKDEFELDSDMTNGIFVEKYESPKATSARMMKKKKATPSQIDHLVRKSTVENSVSSSKNSKRLKKIKSLNSRKPSHHIISTNSKYNLYCRNVLSSESMKVSNHIIENGNSSFRDVQAFTESYRSNNGSPRGIYIIDKTKSKNNRKKLSEFITKACQEVTLERRMNWLRKKGK